MRFRVLCPLLFVLGAVLLSQSTLLGIQKALFSLFADARAFTGLTRAMGSARAVLTTAR